MDGCGDILITIGEETVHNSESSRDSGGEGRDLEEKTVHGKETDSQEAVEVVLV